MNCFRKPGACGFRISKDVTCLKVNRHTTSKNTTKSVDDVELCRMFLRKDVYFTIEKSGL